VEGDGRAYLEKIVQVVHDIPTIREVDLSRVLADEISRIIGQAPTGPFDEHEFWNVFHTVIRPLFRNVRDVRRYADALTGDRGRGPPDRRIGPRSDTAPGAFAKLPAAAETLTTTSAGSGMGKSSDGAKAKIEEFEKAGGDHVQAIREARRHLFPANSWIENTHHGGDWLKTWSKERRVAHPRV
jgi:hypothetical protein